MIKEIELSARAVKLLLLGAVLVALALFFRLWLHERESNIQLRDTVQVAGQQATATSGITKDVSTATADADKEVQRLAALRREWQTHYQKVLNENQGSADWAAQPIPRELRQLACERRVARDSLAASAAGSGAADTGTETCL